MLTVDQVLEFKQKLHEESNALIAKKGHDYSRAHQADGDTLFNLRVAELLRIVPTAEQGILVRLSDKFMRLISLMSPGVQPTNVNESVRDTVLDIMNYTSYALQIWEERQTVNAPIGPLANTRAIIAETVASGVAENTQPFSRHSFPNPARKAAYEEVPHSSGFGVLIPEEEKMKR
jgi:hypothetical protein